MIEWRHGLYTCSLLLSAPVIPHNQDFHAFGSGRVPVAVQKKCYMDDPALLSQCDFHWPGISTVSETHFLTDAGTGAFVTAEIGKTRLGRHRCRFWRAAYAQKFLRTPATVLAESI